jgi:hypothetical protein
MAVTKKPVASDTTLPFEGRAPGQQLLRCDDLGLMGTDAECYSYVSCRRRLLHFD